MGLRCLFGHDAAEGMFVFGLIVGACSRCARTIIKRPGGRWYPLPKGYIVPSEASGAHPASPGFCSRTRESRLHFFIASGDRSLLFLRCAAAPADATMPVGYMVSPRGKKAAVCLGRFSLA